MSSENLYDYEKACEEIISFDSKMKAIFSTTNPLRKALMGKYGEFVVAKEFQTRGQHPKGLGGNLTSYDLEIGSTRIEVRTSELKRERAFPELIRAWGWKLQTYDNKG